MFNNARLLQLNFLAQLKPFFSPFLYFSRPYCANSRTSNIASSAYIPRCPPLAAAITTVTATHVHSDLLSLLPTLHSLRQTKQCHAAALVRCLLPQSVSLCAALILNYASYHCRPELCLVLFKVTAPYCKTAFLGNTLIRAYSIIGTRDGFSVYNGMLRSGIKPDDYTFPFVLKACADSSAARKGREVHGTAVKLGLDLDLFVGNTLLLFYSSCGDLGRVERLFDEMPERDAVSWNTVIGAFSVQGFYGRAVDVFMEMKVKSELMPNVASVVSVLPVCAELKDELTARLVHGYVFKAGLNNTLTVANALVHVYAKCGDMASSTQAFDEIPDKNSVSWNAVITGFAHLKCYGDAMGTFISMLDAGQRPDGITISSTLPSLVELNLFDAGKEIHAFTIRLGLDSDLFVTNSLIDMYAKSGHPKTASDVFERMSIKNEVSWNTMIANLAQNNQELKAIELFREMQLHDGVIPTAMTFTNVLPACARMRSLRCGKEIHCRSIRSECSTADIFLSNALMDMYAKCGSLTIARTIFDSLSEKDQVSYNILIVNYSQTVDCSESLSLFKQMDSEGNSIPRDTVSYMGVISACANLSDLKKGKEVHGYLVKNMIDFYRHHHNHLFIANSLLDLYTKCGRIDLARRVFERIPSKDTASWNTMILGYGMKGELHEAMQLFQEMKEDLVMKPDSVSYVIVLSICSHGGLVEEGKRYFDEMRSEGQEPRQMHYACMVDLLGRAGLMDEAVELIRNLPFEPDSNIWGALLGACRVHGNVELAKWAAENLFVLKPEHCGYYTILSNMLSEAGRWDEARAVRQKMKSRGVKKDPAFSWVEGRNKEVHAFFVGEIVDPCSSPWLTASVP